MYYRILLFIFALILSIFSANEAYGLEIPVGIIPFQPAIDETTNKVFVAHAGSSDVYVIDGKSGSPTENTVLSIIPVGAGPTFVAVNPITHFVYTSNNGGNSVSVIDGTTDTNIATINVGSGPVGIGIDSVNNRIFAGNIFSGTVSVIDGFTNTVINTVTVAPGASRIAYDQILNKLFVTNFFSNTLHVIDGSSLTLIDTITIGAAPSGVAVDPNTHMVYASNRGSNTVSVIDGNNHSLVTTISTGVAPTSVAVDTVRNKVYSTNDGDSTISIIDPATNTVIATVPVGAGPAGVAVDLSNGKVYTANRGSNTVTVLELTGENPPIANAGPNQIIDEGTVVMLDGTGSSDPDGDLITYLWTQTQGPSVILSDETSPTPTFTAPLLAKTDLVSFELVVNDNTFNSPPDEVDIVVIDSSTFSVTLGKIGSKLQGQLNIGDLISNKPITLDFLNPSDTFALATLEEATLTSGVSGNNVEFSITIENEIADNLPNLPTDTALFFDIEATGIDFSDPTTFPPNNFPNTRFLVDKQEFLTKDTFSDGCSVIDLFLFEETLNQWEQLGTPISPESNKIYTTIGSSNKVLVVDGSTNEEIKTITVGDSPGVPIFDPTTNRLYVPNRVSETISVIDTLSDTVIATIPGKPSSGNGGVDTSTNRVYISNRGSEDVIVIDGKPGSPTDLTVIATIPVGVNPGQSSVDSRTNRVYVSNFFSNTVSVIDGKPGSPTENTVIATIPTSTFPSGSSIDEDNNLLYVSILGFDFISVIDIEPGAPNENTVIDNITVEASPSGNSIDPFTKRLYVANLVGDSVSVIDLSIRGLVATIPVGNSPFDVQINPNTGRAYVSNEQSNSLSVIDGIPGSPTENSVIDTILLSDSPFRVALKPDIPNPVRDPSTDIKNNDGEILQCAYLGELPHLSKFAIGGIRALALGALAGGGGGSTGGSAPSLNNIAFDGVTTVNEDGILEFGGLVIDKIAPVNNFPTQKVKTGVPFELRLPFYEDNGIGSLQHVAVYFLQGDEKTIYDSQTSIIYEPNSSVEFSDAAGLISNVSAEGIVKSAYDVDVVFGMTFNFPTDEPIDVIVRSWDKHRRSSDIKFNDLILVEFNSPFNIPLDTSQETSPEWSKSVQSSLTKSTTIFKEDFDGSFITIDTENGQSITRHTAIPLWIKNNAHWWSQDEIDNDDFVASVQYLIEKDVLSVPKRHVISILETVPPAEIPNWIKSNAKWWASGSISDEEFVQSMQWLIEKGIMRV